MTTPRVVLVGGGHAHVLVLEAFAAGPRPECRLTVVVDRPVAVYSGMVPGFVAGQYCAEDLEIDVRPLVERVGGGVVIARATNVDWRERRIVLEDREPLPYDVASFNIGSTVAGLECPGVREHAVPTRPIADFIGRVEELGERLRTRDPGPPFRVVVVGGGVGGVELAFTLLSRLGRERGGEVEVLLLEKGRRIRPGYGERLVRRVRRLARARGIEIRCEQAVVGVEAGAVELDGGERLACDALIWVTGAVSHPLFRTAGLPTDDRGFVRVRSTLQVEGHDELLAVGDCATLIDHPRTPKAGVYAVRQGPFVTHNIRALLAGRPLRSYRPQHDFLTLLNLGDGLALGAKWGRSIEGAWVMNLKDWIDRRFVRRFQLINDGGAADRNEGR